MQHAQAANASTTCSDPHQIPTLLLPEGEGVKLMQASIGTGCYVGRRSTVGEGGRDASGSG